MSWRLRCSLWIYAIGAIVMEALLLVGAYQAGGFERSHTFWDLIAIGALHLVTAALWPLVIVVVALQWFGVLPQPITF